MTTQLPKEIWLLIALTDSKTYNLVVRSVHALYPWATNSDTLTQLKRAWLCKIDNSYRLPNGWLHRTDGPAIIHEDNSHRWYYHDKLHRENGPAIEAESYQEWWRHGLKHRDNGPAVDALNRKEWWVNGVLHRENGPAIIGNVYVEYHFHGKFIYRKFY
jgi:hypothetical protein